MSSFELMDACLCHEMEDNPDDLATHCSLLHRLHKETQKQKHRSWIHDTLQSVGIQKMLPLGVYKLQ